MGVGVGPGVELDVGVGAGVAAVYIRRFQTEIADMAVNVPLVTLPAAKMLVYVPGTVSGLAVQPCAAVVGVGVGAGVGVCTGVGVAVGTGVAVGVCAGVGVLVAPPVGAAVGVLVAPPVGAGLGLVDADGGGEPPPGLLGGSETFDDSLHDARANASAATATSTPGSRCFESLNMTCPFARNVRGFSC